MLIWRGWGILVLVISGASLVATQLVVNAVIGADTYSSNVFYPAVGTVIAVALVWSFAKYLESHTPSRTVVDKKTGREIVLKRHNDLFFIDVKYWPYIIAGFGIIMTIADLLKK